MTKIEWVKSGDGSQGKTWNPVAGCSVLTPGCTNCYAMKMAGRLEAMGQELYKGLTKPTKAGPVWTGIMRPASDDVLFAPLRRKKPTTWFVNSMSDLFHENTPDEVIDRIFAVMALTPHHTYQVLTKRAERMREYCSNPRSWARVWEEKANLIASGFSSGHDSEWPLFNVWLGVSTERRQEADERIPLLLQTPAAVRFISAEPLLGPIDIFGYVGEGGGWQTAPGDIRKLDWVIVGGESGHDARPMHPDWARSLRDQCAAAGIPFFYKQAGEWLHRDCVNVSREHGAFNADGTFDGGLAWPAAQQLLKTHIVMEKVGKKAAGRLLDGIEHNGMPTDHVLTPSKRSQREQA